MRRPITRFLHGGCSSGGCGTKSSATPTDNVSLVKLNISATPKSSSKERPQRTRRPFAATPEHPQGLLIGLDIGSTTVKAVVVDPVTDQILWKDYQRHDTKQPEKTLEFLRRIEAEFGIVPDDGRVGHAHHSPPAAEADQMVGNAHPTPVVGTAHPAKSSLPRSAVRIFLTGSGSSGIAARIGGRFVQEVNAVSLAVEKLYPDVQSVVELGGQDAKIIVFKTEEQSGKKKKIPSMNDKCAGGTGAVIDKINAKLKIPAEKLAECGYYGLKLHPVAGKCGVFAETDINGLQKTGVPSDELMASLFESIIQQNLSVLTRGHTLRPKVLLLGGPNTYIRGMLECWRANIPTIWRERGVQLPEGYYCGHDATPEQMRKAADDLIIVPDNAQYFAALGAVEFGKIEIADDPDTGVYEGPDDLLWYVTHGRIEEKLSRGAKGLSKGADDLAEFKERFRKKPWSPAKYASGTRVRAFLGVDGGSTSTKGVLLDVDKKVIAKSYQLSKGNPIEDTIEIIGKIEKQMAEQGCTLEILGVGTTGYAKDILKDVLGGDTALVETVAHTEACLHFYPQTDVIVDVGGQDIKLIILKHGQVKDFKLNTQCSAGNGYFLQSTAQTFNIPVEQFADRAFEAEAMPEFGYGCAVFMQSDIVDFQRQGWQPHEIMAGLAAVLPKNIWLYVSQIPNIAKLGTNFVLQGGTQHNLAAVKSQVDFIESRFPGTGLTPNVIVHEHCGESGAIGCAIEAHRLWDEQGLKTTFIGLERVSKIQYRTTRDENTRCYFCKNKCLRTFIDVKSESEGASPAAGEGAGRGARGAGVALPVVAAADNGNSQSGIDLVTHTSRVPGEDGRPSRIKRGTAESVKKSKSKVPLLEGEQRLIIATCEKGTVEDVNDMRDIKAGLDAVKKANPNLVEIAAKDVFKPTGAASVADPIPAERPSRLSWLRIPWKGNKETKEQGNNGAADGELAHGASRAQLMRRRATYRVGIPRLLNIYSTAPFFMAWFESLGIKADNLVYSDYTSEEMYKEGAKRGSIDPCFPSKIGIPHVHNLLYHKHTPRKREQGTGNREQACGVGHAQHEPAAPGAQQEVGTAHPTRSVPPLDCIFFPMIDALPSFLEGCQSHRACPTVAITPEAVKAAFTKESDLFAQLGVKYVNPLVDLCKPLLAAREMYNAFKDEIGVSEEESRRAVQAGLAALADYDRRMREKAREVLDAIEREDRLAVVVLARPYHNDPGLNHEICDELQKLGYPILTQDCLPLDADILERLFGDEVRARDFRSPLSIEDAWKNSYSENTSRKVWAAKYAARHPNLVALELSSFKCGHDAPIYTVVEEVIENSGTPYFCFKDIDENKPSGSIKIRIETIGYFLKRYRERLVSRKRRMAEIEQKLSMIEMNLREEVSRERHGQLIEV
ncbi:Activator of (R)-2-hydroxyglutaryl-CoA dehydratase [Phycisphaerae bacterium RAS1]|nr:Activator of (R)-2-hydroxyglutaryl-CoA dehydratase [Phycisphaerae bacterium RAS1]